MLHVLDTMLDSSEGKPKRLTTRHGTTLIISDPGQAAAVLNDARFIRIDFLSLVFGPGIVFSEDRADSIRRDILRKQFGGKLVGRFLQNAHRVFQETKERWRSLDGPCDLSTESNRLTLDIFCRSALDFPIGSHFDSLSQALTWGVRAMGTFARLSVGESVALSPSFNKELEKVKIVFDQFARTLIQKSRKRDSQSDFLLDALCQSGLSDREISDEITNLLLAGGDTSSLALTWSLISLRDKPAARARIKEEAENFLGPEPDAADLAKLQYTTAVVDETLRLFPPVWHMLRRAKEDVELDGETLPAGTDVIVSPYLNHRCPAHWDKPLEFQPERFLSEPKPSARSCYYPFSRGHHVCLGRKAGLHETALLLALMIRDTELEFLDETYLPGDAATLRPDGPVNVRITLR